MSVETAKSIVDYELKNFADFEGIEFDLFGGEPFLAFDLVREITDYISFEKSIMDFEASFYCLVGRVSSFLQCLFQDFMTLYRGSSTAVRTR